MMSASERSCLLTPVAGVLLRKVQGTVNCLLQPGTKRHLHLFPVPVSLFLSPFLFLNNLFNALHLKADPLT